MKKAALLLPCLFIMMVFSCRKSDYLVEPSAVAISDNGGGTGTITWLKGKEYLLEGRVFVNDGQVLTIEPGAVIRFKQGKGSGASALIVARGGKLIAEGTAADPIVFTADDDDLKGSIGLEASGLWGGLVLLGSASINTLSGEAQIEGIPQSESRAVYGGDNDNDNSGILKYLSIRHAGTQLGSDNEINGLTLGGVGKGTVIENVEVISNADDGIEIFGGTVNLKRIVVTYCDDDGIDIDLGYRGNIQSVCIIQHPDFGDKILEIDGAEAIKTARPHSLPVIYNLTAVGRGEVIQNYCVVFADNAGGLIANSIFTNQGFGIGIEFSSVRQNSFTQWENGKLQIKNSAFHLVNHNTSEQLFRIRPINDEEAGTLQFHLDQYFMLAGNRFDDPEFIIDDSGYSLIPKNPSTKENHAALPVGDDFFDQAPYLGAFGTYNWVGEWTLTGESGIVW